MSIHPALVRHSAFRITAIYLVVGGLWILLSDWALGLFIDDPARLTQLQTYKGWFFVALTAALLYGLIRREMRQREKMIQELHESRQRFQTIVETAPIPLLIANLSEGAVLWANSYANTTLGFAGRGVVGHALSDLHSAQEAHPNLFEVIQAEHFITQMEMPIVDGEGHPIWVVISTRRNTYENQDAVFCALIDITRNKEQEKENLQLQSKVQHTQKLESLGLMAGGIAHDFNNLLTSIMGNADLASMDLPAESMASRAVERTKAAASAAAELTQQLLAYSGKGRARVEPVDVNALITEMAEMLKVSISGKIEMAIELAPELESIEADQGQLRQVILNLLTNASEAIGDEHGTIKICTGKSFADRALLSQVTMGQSLPEGDYLYFEVSDSGCGMNAEQRDKIFDPFFTTKIQGRGLGLAAVLGIARSHHGGLKVYSEVGHGTTFRVYFPLGVKGSELIEPVDNVSLVEWKAEGTFLIADDDPNVLNVARKMIERFGFTVLTACNGREAVDIFTRNHEGITAVLLDLVMPELDGFEALKAMREIRPDVPVILSSGFSEADGFNHLSEQDLAMFIKKPYTVKNLMGKVREVLQL